MNAAMMMNEAMFSGTGGWTNKPVGYRNADNDVVKSHRTSFDLRVEILAAQNLDPEARSAPNAFIKCELHVGNKDGESIPREGKNKGGEWKRRSAVRHSKDPDFAGDTLEFLGVEAVIPELSFIRWVIAISNFVLRSLSQQGLITQALSIAARVASSISKSKLVLLFEVLCARGSTHDRD